MREFLSQLIKEGFTLLEIAPHDKVEIMVILLENGANPNAYYSNGKWYKRPQVESAINGPSRSFARLLTLYGATTDGIAEASKNKEMFKFVRDELKPLL